MDFSAWPPEIVSAWIHAGPGAESLIEASGAFGSFEFDVFARASPRNPKSSALTAYSLLQCGRLGLGLPAFAFLGAPCE